MIIAALAPHNPFPRVRQGHSFDRQMTSQIPTAILGRSEHRGVLDCPDDLHLENVAAGPHGRVIPAQY
jgi:hypothetical protein